MHLFAFCLLEHFPIFTNIYKTEAILYGYFIYFWFFCFFSFTSPFIKVLWLSIKETKITVSLPPHNALYYFCVFDLKYTMSESWPARICLLFQKCLLQNGKAEEPMVSSPAYSTCWANHYYSIFPVLSIINNEAGILELLAKKTVSFQLYY